MRHLFFVLLSAAAATSIACAQIPNAGFESWAEGVPVGWATSNASPVYANVTQSSTAHGGTSAARGEVISIGGPYPIQPILQSGAEGEGFPLSTRPAAVTGWYQFSPVGGDRFGINVVLFKGGVQGTAVATAVSADSMPHGSYYQFNVPFLYVSADVPDTCVIQHQIIGPTTGITWHVGSWFLLDDLAFSGTNDVASEPGEPGAFMLHQNYPNPFNPKTVVSSQLPVASWVRLVVYDLLGREVAVLMDEYKAPGTYRIEFSAQSGSASGGDGAKLASGVYICRMIAGDFVSAKKMVLQR